MVASETQIHKLRVEMPQESDALRELKQLKEHEQLMLQREREEEEQKLEEEAAKRRAEAGEEEVKEDTAKPKKKKKAALPKPKPEDSVNQIRAIDILDF